MQLSSLIKKSNGRNFIATRMFIEIGACQLEETLMVYRHPLSIFRFLIIAVLNLFFQLLFCRSLGTN